MWSGVWNVVMGVIGIVLYTQGFYLPYIPHPLALPAISAAIAALGIYQIVRALRRSE